MSHDLTAQDIKRIREKYGLTQQGFARLLGLGDASVVRYENGQTPSKANANLIRAAENPEFVADCLKRDGGLLSVGQREKTEKIVYALVSFDEEGDIMDINEMYEITLQQEVLNEQAAQLAGKTSNLLIAARKKGDKVATLVYEDALKQLAQIKPSITYRENSNRIRLAELKGKIDCLSNLVRGCAARAA
jgi:HTH-type transcriptional regulator / antitoxin PezA